MDNFGRLIWIFAELKGRQKQDGPYLIPGSPGNQTVQSGLEKPQVPDGSRQVIPASPGLVGIKGQVVQKMIETAVSTEETTEQMATHVPTTAFSIDCFHGPFHRGRPQAV